MEAWNLVEEDCGKLEETMKEIAKTNPEATHRFFKQGNEADNKDSTSMRLDRIEEKIDALNGRLDRIFGNAVLLEGRFHDIGV